MAIKSKQRHSLYFLNKLAQVVILNGMYDFKYLISL